jgi:hypothetical protein
MAEKAMAEKKRGSGGAKREMISMKESEIMEEYDMGWKDLKKVVEKILRDEGREGKISKRKTMEGLQDKKGQLCCGRVEKKDGRNMIWVEKEILDKIEERQMEEENSWEKQLAQLDQEWEEQKLKDGSEEEEEIPESGQDDSSEQEEDRGRQEEEGRGSNGVEVWEDEDGEKIRHEIIEEEEMWAFVEEQKWGSEATVMRTDEGKGGYIEMRPKGTHGKMVLRHYERGTIMVQGGGQRLRGQVMRKYQEYITSPERQERSRERKKEKEKERSKDISGEAREGRPNGERNGQKEDEEPRWEGRSGDADLMEKRRRQGILRLISERQEQQEKQIGEQKRMYPRWRKVKNTPAKKEIKLQFIAPRMEMMLLPLLTRAVTEGLIEGGLDKREFKDTMRAVEEMAGNIAQRKGKKNVRKTKAWERIEKALGKEKAYRLFGGRDGKILEQIHEKGADSIKEVMLICRENKTPEKPILEAVGDGLTKARGGSGEERKMGQRRGDEGEKEMVIKGEATLAKTTRWIERRECKDLEREIERLVLQKEKRDNGSESGNLIGLVGSGTYTYGKNRMVSQKSEMLEALMGRVSDEEGQLFDQIFVKVTKNGMDGPKHDDSEWTIKEGSKIVCLRVKGNCVVRFFETSGKRGGLFKCRIATEPGDSYTMGGSFQKRFLHQKMKGDGIMLSFRKKARDGEKRGKKREMDRDGDSGKKRRRKLLYGGEGPEAEEASVGKKKREEGGGRWKEGGRSGRNMKEEGSYHSRDREWEAKEKRQPGRVKKEGDKWKGDMDNNWATYSVKKRNDQEETRGWGDRGERGMGQMKNREDGAKLGPREDGTGAVRGRGQRARGGRRDVRGNRRQHGNGRAWGGQMAWLGDGGWRANDGWGRGRGRGRGRSGRGGRGGRGNHRVWSAQENERWGSVPKQRHFEREQHRRWRGGEKMKLAAGRNEMTPRGRTRRVRLMDSSNSWPG